MNPLSLRIFSVNNFTSSITSKMVPFGNSYSTLTKIWSEKGCETTYQRWFSRAVIKTTMTGIRSAGPFPSLFPRAHGWKDLLPKWFASSAIISADSFRKCISCLKCILTFNNSVLPKRVTSVWHKVKTIILSRGSGSNGPVVLSRSVLLLCGVKGLCGHCLLSQGFQSGRLLRWTRVSPLIQMRITLNLLESKTCFKLEFSLGSKLGWCVGQWCGIT